jgi:hypothetical protein
MALVIAAGYNGLIGARPICVQRTNILKYAARFHFHVITDLSSHTHLPAFFGALVANFCAFLAMFSVMLFTLIATSIADFRANPAKLHCVLTSKTH